MSIIDRLATNVGPQDGATPQEWAALVMVDAGLVTSAVRNHQAALQACLAKGWIIRGGACGLQLSATAPRTVAS